MVKLTPQKIYENYKKKILNKFSVIEQLINLIENSDKIKTRIESIKVLGKIEKNNNIFELLENLLISDLSEKVRNAAAEVLKNNYMDKALEPLKWAFQHEESPLCLKTIFDSLIFFLKKQGSKSILLNEIKNIKDKEFKISFERLCETRTTEDFINKELIEILINYYTISFLKKIFWRLKFKIKGFSVVELNFLFKGLTTIPDAIKYLTSLKNLIFRYNQIVYLPDWIGSFNSLEILNLNINNLIRLPESIGDLSSLKHLSLWKNELTNLPDSIGSLSSLETLNLRLNQLKLLPDSCGHLKSLKELNLHDNKLTSIPDSIANLSKLEKLNLSWNVLKTLPDNIKGLKSLEFLDLERNELIVIPDSIGSLSSLETLNLSDNKIKRLPDSIGGLKSLQTLNLIRNELSDIPKSLSTLPLLKELFLRDNKIYKLPKWLRDLKNKGLKIDLQNF